MSASATQGGHNNCSSSSSNTHGAAHMTPLFGPHQLGVGIQGVGRQPPILRAVTYKLWLQTTLWSNLILQMRLTVCVDLICCCPSATAYPSSMPSASHLYSQPSFLYFGSHVLLSDEGPQQGDPLGSLLLFVPLFIRSLPRWVPTSGYLDDLTLAGPHCGCHW